MTQITKTIKITLFLLLLTTSTLFAQTITSISPNPVTAGSAAFTLTVNGTGFVPTSAIQMTTTQGGTIYTTLTTTYVNASQLTALVQASYITLGGTRSVRVNNPGISNVMTLTVNYPVPTIANLAPNYLILGSNNSISVLGTGYFSTSSVQIGPVSGAGPWNNLTVTSSSSTSITVNGFSTMAAGYYAIRVSNPTPGGRELWEFSV